MARPFGANRQRYVAALAAALPYFLISAVGWRFDSLSGVTYVGGALYFASTYLVPAVCVFLILRVLALPVDSFGLTNPLKHRSIAVFLSLQFLVFVAFKSSVIVHAVLVMTLPESWHAGLIDYRKTTGLSVESVVYRGIFAPFMEEFFFRAFPAFMLGAISGGWLARGLYVLLSAALFAQFHIAYGFAAWILLFYVGLISASLYIALRNLWFLIVAHALSNIVDMAWVSR